VGGVALESWDLRSGGCFESWVLVGRLLVGEG
jgi:hypothetical protein